MPLAKHTATIRKKYYCPKRFFAPTDGSSVVNSWMDVRQSLYHVMLSSDKKYRKKTMNNGKAQKINWKNGWRANVEAELTVPERILDDEAGPISSITVDSGWEAGLVLVELNPEHISKLTPVMKGRSCKGAAERCSNVALTARGVAREITGGKPRALPLSRRRGRRRTRQRRDVPLDQCLHPPPLVRAERTCGCRRSADEWANAQCAPFWKMKTIKIEVHLRT